MLVHEADHGAYMWKVHGDGEDKGRCMVMGRIRDRGRSLHSPPPEVHCLSGLRFIGSQSLQAVVYGSQVGLVGPGSLLVGCFLMLQLVVWGIGRVCQCLMRLPIPH